MNNKKGEGYISICVFVVCICLIISVLITFVTSVEAIKQIKKNSRTVLDSLVMANSVEIYGTLKNGTDITEALDVDEYISALCEFNSLKVERNRLVFKDKNGNIQYSITKPKLGFTEENRMKLQVSYTVITPIYFSGIKVSEAHTPITVTSDYSRKF